MHNVKLHFGTQAAARSISHIQIVYLDNIVYSTGIRRTADLDNAGPAFPYYRRYYIRVMPPQLSNKCDFLFADASKLSYHSCVK
jgi:hypothetical protein